MMNPETVSTDRPAVGPPRAGGRPSVCVIGAGMSGLAAVRELGAAGFEVVCYEGGSGIGGMWRYENDSGLSAAYESLQTNTSRSRMEYPSFPQRSDAPEFPSHRDMLAYLEQYAVAGGLADRIVFGAGVERAERVQGAWEVRLADGRERRFDWLVVASGHCSKPRIPAIPGRFDGAIAHVRDYRTPAPYAGKRVVVLGGAQSALDIVAEVATVADTAVLACDHVHHLLPRYAFGRPLDHRDTAASLLVPLPIVRLILGAVTRLGRTRPSRGELPAPRHPLFESHWPIITTAAVEQAIESGAFSCRPGVVALEGGAVRFGDGSTFEADGLLLATGYEIDFPFLAPELGAATGSQFPLYRRILSPRAPGLAFVGLVEAGPGMFAVVERQSRWLAEVIGGGVPVPDGEAMWRSIDAGERRSRRQFTRAGRHTIFCNRHAYMRVLAKDLRRARASARGGARPRAGRRLPGSLAGARLQARAMRTVARTLLAAPRSGELAEIERGRYALIVSYRRDGTPVATPVWAAVRDGRIFVRTERSSGKVRRIERDARVLVAASTSAGRPVGSPLAARARVLAPAEEAVAESALASRFGLARASFERAMDAMRIDMCYLELTPVAPDHDRDDARVPRRMVARQAGNRVGSMQHERERG